MKPYDVAAYVWPAYTGKEARTRIFWEQGIGEWQSVQTAEAKFEGHTWPRRPLWGYVDEACSKVMEMEIDEATKHGVNVFIYDWYWYDGRPFLEQCLNDGFLKASNRSKMKFYIMWANHDAGYTWDKRNSDTVKEKIWRGAVDETQFRIATDHIIQDYFSQPEYYRIDGKPVLMIYDVQNLLCGLGGLDNAVRAIADLRRRVRAAGFPDLHLQFTFRSKNQRCHVTGVDSEFTGDIFEALERLGVDSISHYQFAHFADMNRDYREITEDVLQEWDMIRARVKIPYFPHVSIGWDNNPRFRKLIPNITTGNTPEEFEKMLRQAKQFSDAYNSVPLITVNSWNEWTETSYLQPDDRNGYGYLEAVKAVFKEE